MSQLVFVQNNSVVTDSLTVSEQFGKQHRHVMRDIKIIIEKLEDPSFIKEARELDIEVGSPKFEHTHYTHSQNKQIYAKYLMNFDAFMLVTMSYTTQKAMLIKMKYMNEFNTMKEKLDSKFNLPTNYKEALLQLVDKEEENERLQLENRMYQQEIAENKPKLTYVDEVLKSTDLMVTTQIADDYGMSAQEFNKLLHKHGVQYKMNGQWLLYSRHKGNGYTKSETHTHTRKNGETAVTLYSKWTQKGRLFLYELLKSKNILPTMEQMKLTLVEKSEVS